jgi:cytochrome c oxidase cbb3-type subunit I/II
MNKEVFSYNNRIVRNFAYATILWGIVGMLVGVIIAFQLVEPRLNLTPWTTFGRIRPLHTNAVIFAFVGNAIFMGIYHSLQRLLKTRLFSSSLANIHFWAWQLIIVSAALTLPLGITTSKEYAELEWPIDIAITLVWVVFGINMFGTILKRREKHIYVGIWFYIATWVTVAMLHIVNSVEMPVTFLKSYSWYAGVQDALVQWWYGHNAVAFFLTTPFLGLMYYYMPKMANRPIYSYKLSILHFWSLIFIYIWAGPHHLLYSSLPDWAQQLGVAFSIMLIAPSWGGMLNGLLTLRGAWDKVRDDVMLKFMVVALTAYGMATFEGPMLSLKFFNGIAHFTDWIVAHAHVGALGWNGFMTFAMLYYIIPKIFNTRLYSKKAANTHFWIGTLGIIFYAVPMYFSGWTQGSMWTEFNPDGSLKYEFVETTSRILYLHVIRGFGGLMYLTGAIIMAWNLIMTVRNGSFVADEQTEAYPMDNSESHAEDGKPAFWHKWIEVRPITMLVFSLVAVSIGGLVQLVPTFIVKSNIPTISSVKPYSPLELVGRDIYIREGCNSCHSQLVRPFPAETERYGEYAKAGEGVYDHPFLWGSKRTGPDLSRGGVKTGPSYKAESWHWRHMNNPTDVNKASIMPQYSWLTTDEMDLSSLKAKIKALRTVGVPYEKGYENNAEADLDREAAFIVEKLRIDGIKATRRTEIVALIAYLHKLGRDLEPAKVVL